MTDVKITTLSNGLRVITDHVPSVESVAVGVWVGVGTRFEDMKYNGAAHMVEHMLFKGTPKRDALQIAEVIENVGGHMNAYTSREMTSYHIHLLKQDLSLALDVLADIVQHSTMPQEEIERERGVILQEIGMCHDTPDDVIFDHFYETAYPRQALGAPILGTNDIISNMTREALMGYTQKFYTPKRTVICASGNVAHDEFIAEVERLFTDLPADQEYDKVPAAYHGGQHRSEKDLEQSHIILGFQGVNRLDNDYYTAQTLATLLGGGMSSRLFQEVREKRGLVYSIYAFHSAHTDDGQFGIYAGTGPDKLTELIPVVCNEIKILAGSLKQAEIERAKSQLRASNLMSRESMMTRADQNAKSVLLHGYVRTADEILSRINAVNEHDLRRVADKIFSSKPILTALGPLENLESYETMTGRLHG